MIDPARFHRFGIRSLLLAGTSLTFFSAAPALAQGQPDVAAQIEALRGELAAQRSLIEEQRATIIRQQQAIEELSSRVQTNELATLRGAGVGQSGDAPATPGLPAPRPTPTVPTATASAQMPDQPVGEAPPERDIRAEVRAVPVELGVLTPRGTLTLDPSIEYVASTNNRLVFRGIELIPGIQIGAIEASDVDRDTIVETMAARYGITSRLEAEIRIPYLYRRDRIEVVQQRDEGIVRRIDLEQDDIGDVEFALRYQINRARPLSPIWIAQLRVKSNTGRSPFEIPFDEFGVATGLATGSGFWGVQPGINFLLPSDPVVIFGGVSYLWNIAGNVDRDIGGVFVGRVDPGDAINANLGFGFALNPRFSFSLGYRHTYVFPTSTELGDTVQRSNRASVGVFGFGMSYRVTERETLNFGFSFGVTDDAPDVGISVRMPLDVRVSE